VESQLFNKGVNDHYESENGRNAAWGLSHQPNSASELNVAPSNTLDGCNQKLEQKQKTSSLQSLPTPPPLQDIQTVSSPSSATKTSCTSDPSTKYHWMAHFILAFLLAWTWYHSHSRVQSYGKNIEGMEQELVGMGKNLCDLEQKELKNTATFKSRLALAEQTIGYLQRKLADANQRISNLMSTKREDQKFHELQMSNNQNYFEMKIDDLTKTLEVKDMLIQGLKHYKNLYQEQSLKRVDQFSSAAAFLCEMSRTDLQQIETLKEEKNQMIAANTLLKEEIMALEDQMGTVSKKREKELRELLLLRLKVFR